LATIKARIELAMLEVVKKLLILQDRDRGIRRLEGELSQIDPQKKALQQKTAGALHALETAKNQVRQCESDRKNLELEVDGKKNQILRYANQQLETRKNEEYRALANQIEGCKAEITQIEDKELDLMERGEKAQKDVIKATKTLDEARKLMEEQLSKLSAREESLKKDLDALETSREELFLAVDESARARYERLLRSKGENVIVGIQHGVCGGCHMRVPAQVLVACQAQQELVTCTNCGRILYFTSDMDLAIAD
jgi:predicted  nucleic acid-binding Zn-ribbon protein